MRTREDAGGPGALGRVRTIRRVAFGGLWLAVRALAAPTAAGLLVERKVASSTEVERLRHLLQAAPGLAVPALAPPVLGLESEGFLTYSRPGDSAEARARIAAHAGLCGTCGYVPAAVRSPARGASGCRPR